METDPKRPTRCAAPVFSATDAAEVFPRLHRVGFRVALGIMLPNFGNANPHVRAGRLRAVTGETRVTRTFTAVIAKVVEMDTILEQFATFANELQYRDLPPPVVAAARNRLADAVACGIGAYDCDIAQIGRSVASPAARPELAGRSRHDRH